MAVFQPPASDRRTNTKTLEDGLRRHSVDKPLVFRADVPTFVFVAGEAHRLRRVDGVEGSGPVAAVTSSYTASAPLHARRAAVERVAGGHAVVMVAVDEVVAPPVPTI